MKINLIIASLLMTTILTSTPQVIAAEQSNKKIKTDISEPKEDESKEVTHHDLDFSYHSKIYINLQLGTAWAIGNSTSHGSIGAFFELAPGYHFNESISAGLFYQIGASIGFFDENTITPTVFFPQLYGLEFDYYATSNSNTRFNIGLKTGFVNTTSLDLFLFAIPSSVGRYVAPFIGPKFGIRNDNSKSYSFGFEISPQWVFPTTIQNLSAISEPTQSTIDGQFRIELSLVFALRVN